jgi:HlyD family secretion protein
MMKRVITILFILSGVVGASVAGYQYLTPTEPKDLAEDPSVEIVKIGRETLVDTVNASGRIEPKAEVEMRFETAGSVAEVLVERGQNVTAGAVLARLETEELELAVRRAEIDLAQSEAELAQLFEPDLAEEVEAAQAQVASAQAKLAKQLAGPDREAIARAEAALSKAKIALQEAQWAYDQVAYKGDVGAMSQANALQQATLDYEAALADYNDAVAGPGETDIAEARASLAEARSALAKLLKEPSPAEVTAKQAAVDRARIDLAERQRELKKAELVAPRDGVILEVNIEPGERTFDEANDAAAVVIADTSTYLLKMEVDEIDVGRIRPGQPAAITLDALTGQEFSGRVADVAPRPVKKDNAANAIVTYEVTITFDDIGPDSGLRSGLTANAAIQTQQWPQVVVVPNRAIQIDRASAEPVVFVEKLDEQGRPIRVEVELGSRNGSVTQVVAGLEEGDQVIIRSRPEPVLEPTL